MKPASEKAQSEFGISALIATDDTPHIGVHVLTEFVFCPRAGIVAHEQRRNDPGQDVDAARRLDYLPDFSVREIQDALQRTWTRIWYGLALGLLAGITLLLMTFHVDWIVTVCIVAIGVRPSTRWFWSRCCDVVTLHRRLRAAVDAQPDEPDSALMAIQPVNWWSLRKAGFSVIRYEDAYHGNEAKLSGHPWRILQKGPLRIPVFRKRQGTPEVYPQHFVRMAAYCHLIETCEGAESPYGIVLFEDGCDGLTVPNSSANQQLFVAALLRARRIMESLDSEVGVPDRPPSTVCRACPVGRPVQYIPGLTDTVVKDRTVQPYLTRGHDRRLYHSPCGDRFDWVPPHECARGRKLL